MSIVLSDCVANTLFGSLSTTISGYIESALGASAEDYDLDGIESDLRATVGALLPPGVRLVGERMLADDGCTATCEDVRDAVGWVDVHTVAVGHDMNGPGA